MKNHIFQMMLIVFIIGISGLATAKEVAAKGVTTLSVNIKDSRVQVDIRTYLLDIGKPSDRAPAVRKNICTYSKYPCSPVQGIDIFVGSAKIFVPKSSFADLSDLSSAKLFVKNGSMVLVLDGGDASESYTVKLFFNSEHVYRRLLYPAGDTVEPTEDTKYSLVDIN